MEERLKVKVREILNKKGILVDRISEDVDPFSSKTAMIIEAHLTNSFVSEVKLSKRKSLRKPCASKIGRNKLAGIDIPDKVIFNEKKRSTTLLYKQDEDMFDTEPKSGYNSITVKATEQDTYNKKLGFLIAYFQKTTGFSKTQAGRYLDGLTKVEVPKIDYLTLKVPVLRSLCKERKLKGYAKLKKKDLIELLDKEVK